MDSWRQSKDLTARLKISGVYFRRRLRFEKSISNWWHSKRSLSNLVGKNSSHHAYVRTHRNRDRPKHRGANVISAESTRE
jgi:hypothetical protein